MSSCDTGGVFLIGLGATALLFALLMPRGIWGEIEQRLGLQLLPVGYRLSGRTGDPPPKR
jgi:branched-chain amino acid transport system permease protein